MSPSAPNCFSLCAYPWGKSCKVAGRTKGANLFSIMKIGFWFGDKTDDAVADEDKTKGTCLLELAIVLFRVDTKETKILKSCDKVFVLCKRKSNGSKSKYLKLSIFVASF